jgi:hypothetical protein
MRSAVVLLERSSVISKKDWRDASSLRTFAPIEVGSLIRNAWEANRSDAAEQGSIVASLMPDGAARSTRAVRGLQIERSELIGVFEVSFLAPDRVKVTLREEACTSRLGSPKRHTRQIALLRPWKPVRVLLNGRSASYSGQYYSLREYHLALCIEPRPERLGPTRIVDLQSDLF